MFRLVRYFSITSLAAFVLVTVVLALFYRQNAINDLLVLRESNNVALTQSFANSLWPQFSRFVGSAFTLSPEELAQHEEIARLRQAVLDQMSGLSVVKVKVYDLNGLTVFSSEARQIGEDKSGNAGYLSARNGVVATELTHRDTFSAFEQTIEDRDVISSYVPIQPDGPGGAVEGVFEIYDDVTPLLKRIEQTQRNVILGVVMVLAVLYGILYAIVRRGDRIIRQQAAEREKAEQARAQSEARLRAIVKSAPIMLWAVDQNKRITLLEGRGLRGLDDAIGKPIADIFGHVKQFDSDIDIALTGKEHSSLVMVDDLTFDARYTPLYGEGGKVTGVIGVATDITERLMAEGALGEASLTLEQRSKELARIQDFLSSTLDSLTETLRRSPQQTEVMAYIDQVKTEFSRLN
jgi:PAS domain S-box-containing protein